mmetsp:Transcript_5670/g.16720  ORF Transcript_5670/g.16720 Transcript_5670/m.16720 type:complete len:94 (+) Transcript_5670:263-544(+)
MHFVCCVKDGYGDVEQVLCRRRVVSVKLLSARWAARGCDRHEHHRRGRDVQHARWDAQSEVDVRNHTEAPSGEARRRRGITSRIRCCRTTWRR